MNKHVIPTRLFLSLAVLLSTLGLSADDKTWTGAADASWANPGNWDPSGLISSGEGVVFDGSSAANLDQTLDQIWTVTNITVAAAPGPITIRAGVAGSVLTNTGPLDMSAATSDLTILADYAPVNHGTLTVPAGRTLTFSNILNNIIASPAAIAGQGTVRILGSARRLNDQVGSVTLIVDGGTVAGNPPVRLSADSGSTVTVLVTNNGAMTIAPGSGARFRLGNLPITEGAAGTNRLILDGGTITVDGANTSSASGFYVGDQGGTVGILDINNGTIDLTDRSSGNAYSVMRMGVLAGAVGIVNLNPAGRLLTPRIDRVGGYGIFNFNGGYLRTSISGDYFELVDQVNVTELGAIVDVTSSAVVASFVSPLGGPGGLVKLGPGRLNLTTNSYLGGTTVSNGALGVTLPMASSSLFVASNSTVNVTLGAVANSSWTASTITLQGSNALTFTYGLQSQPSSTLLNPTTLSATGTNMIYISGSGWPAGTIRLIDYSGSINGGGSFVLGPLPVGLNARLTNNPTTTSIDLVVSSGVNNLEWFGNNGSGSHGGLWDIAATANWNGGSSIYNEYGTGTNQLGDSVRFTTLGFNPMVEITTTVRPSSVTVSNTGAITYNFGGPGKISGPTSLVKEGSGASTALFLGTVNDYTGGTFVRVGNLFLNVDNALPTNGLVYIGSPGNGAQLMMNGFNQTVGGIISAGSGSGNRRVVNGSETTVTLTVNVPANQTNTYAHTMGNTGVATSDIANNFVVIKKGAGIQSFANSAYAGATTIEAGTLLFNGNANTLAGTITVMSGGALGGNTTGGNAVGAPVVVQSGGRVEPGNLGIGILLITNTVTLGGDTIIQLNRTNTLNADRLVGTSIALGGNLIVTNAGEALVAGNTFTILGGSLSGGFSSVTLPPLAAGLAWNTSNLAVNGTLTVVSVPQPSFGTTTRSGNDLVFSGTGGPANGTYNVLTSTNVAAPAGTWTIFTTSNFDGTGAFRFTNSVTGGEPLRFFRLQLP